MALLVVVFESLAGFAALEDVDDVEVVDEAESNCRKLFVDFFLF